MIKFNSTITWFIWLTLTILINSLEIFILIYIRGSWIKPEDFRRNHPIYGEITNVVHETIMMLGIPLVLLLIAAFISYYMLYFISKSKNVKFDLETSHKSMPSEEIKRKLSIGDNSVYRVDPSTGIIEKRGPFGWEKTDKRI